MDDRSSHTLVAAGARLLEALEREGLGVLACYWRRLRPTRHQWALVVSLEEFGPTFEPGLTRLLDVWEESGVVLDGLCPLDLWVLEPGASEPARYAGSVVERGPAWPRVYDGDETLPPALLYRLPSP